jgi:hypothetical protein
MNFVMFMERLNFKVALNHHITKSDYWFLVAAAGVGNNRW